MKQNKWKIATIVLSSIIVLWIGGVSVDRAMDFSYDKGFDAGKEDGDSVGYDRGYDEGRASATAECLSEALRSPDTWEERLQKWEDDTGTEEQSADEVFDDHYEEEVSEIPDVPETQAESYAEASVQDTKSSQDIPDTSTTTTSSTDTQSITVYVTNTGSKYHMNGCQYLRQSQNAISLSSAKAAGYTPCSRCHPPQ